MSRLRTVEVEATDIHVNRCRLTGPKKPFTLDDLNTAPGAVEVLGGGVVRSQLGRNFELISDKHGRSMTDATTSKLVVFGGDLPADVYGALSTKGTAFYHDVQIQPYEYALHGFRTLGLMHEAGADKVINYSKQIRDLGLPTEVPVSIKRLKELVIRDRGGHRKVDARDWINKQVDKFESWRVSPSDEDDFEYREKVISNLPDVNYVALERAVQVDERLQDLILTHPSQMLEYFDPIFKWLNAATWAKNSGLITGTPRPEKFGANVESIVKYVYKYIPSQMGTWIGRLHKAGIVHMYPHSQNWSMVATLYDLDSLYESRNPKSRVKDLNRCIEALRGVNGQVSKLRSVNSSNARHFYDYDDMRYDLVTRFLVSYCKEFHGSSSSQNISKLKADLNQNIRVAYHLRDILRPVFQRLDRVEQR